MSATSGKPNYLEEVQIIVTIWSYLSFRISELFTREYLEMNNFKTNRNRRMQGFTLIEIIVVVVIIGLLAAVIAPNIFGQVSEARIKKSLSDLRAIESAMNLYRLDNFNYPTTDQGIQALVTKPSGSPEPKNYRKGGYLKRMPLDPWGSEYQYANPGASGAEFDLFTFGADGKLGGEEDNKDLSIADLR